MTSTRAYYTSEIIDFLIEPADAIIGKIAQRHTQQLEHLQTGAWLSQITCLQQVLQPLKSGQILFEVLIPRMGRRADAVLIYQNILFLIEFKVGAKSYAAQDLRQAHGYAIDLHHFHESSHDKIIVPILLTTEAPAIPNYLQNPIEWVYEPLYCNKDNLFTAISYCVSQIAHPPEITFQTWLDSPYKPTPTIIEAAQALYSQHNVADIARNDAGAQNLHTTSQAIQNIIHQARLNQRKTICFVTGVPGAGKTLVGLNIATSSTYQDHDEHAVFLSGNGPLVEVLTEALARDSLARSRSKQLEERAKGSKKCPLNSNKEKELRSAEAKIQNIHRFRDESLKAMSKPPVEHVVIFDEAQRAWDLANTAKFMMAKRGQAAFNQSEPDFLISVMDRHPDWCAIVALIGGGQEINTGEAGLQGWIDALAQHFPTWDVHYSDKLTQAEYAGRDIDFNGIRHAHPQASLHLATSMRSFRAEKLSHMIHYLIHNQPNAAATCYQQFKDKFPIKITRDLAQAKAWIKSQARATETKGLIASSGAIRLKPSGVFVKNEFSAANWFLNNQDDIRSCHFLEDVATEFDIQGLELDWCLLIF